MITVNVRKQGGAAIMTIPSNVLHLLNIDIGATLRLDVTQEGLMVRPVSQNQRKRYTLKELLDGATPEKVKALNAETKWAREGKRAGRESA